MSPQSILVPMGEDVPHDEVVSDGASFTRSVGRGLGRLCALVSGGFVLATLTAWTLYYFLGDLADGHLDGPAVILFGVYTSIAALFFVGVPTMGVVVVLVQLPRRLPMWAFSGIAAVGLMLPLPMLLALASYVPLPQLLTQAAAQAVTCLVLVYQVSVKSRAG
jgi:hypothetical protein